MWSVRLKNGQSIPVDDVSNPVPANHVENYSRFFLDSR
jgi:hypothetical protein